MLVLTRAQAKQAKEKNKGDVSTESTTSNQKRKIPKNLWKKSKEGSLKDSESDLSMKRILDSRRDQTKPDDPKNEGQKDQENVGEGKPPSETKSNEGGLVIVDRVNKTLEMLMKQWES